jgi:hypothetical protein
LCAFSTQCEPSANARRRPCASAALASTTLDGVHSGREFIGLLMTSGPDLRHQLKARADRARLRRLIGLDLKSPPRRGPLTQVRQGGSELAPDLTEMEATASLRPFFWRTRGTTLRLWLAPANPEHGISRHTAAAALVRPAVSYRRCLVEVLNCVHVDISLRHAHRRVRGSATRGRSFAVANWCNFNGGEGVLPAIAPKRPLSGRAMGV